MSVLLGRSVSLLPLLVFSLLLHGVVFLGLYQWFDQKPVGGGSSRMDVRILPTPFESGIADPSLREALSKDVQRRGGGSDIDIANSARLLPPSTGKKILVEKHHQDSAESRDADRSDFSGVEKIKSPGSTEKPADQLSGFPVNSKIDLESARRLAGESARDDARKPSSPGLGASVIRRNVYEGAGGFSGGAEGTRRHGEENLPPGPMAPVQKMLKDRGVVEKQVGLSWGVESKAGRCVLAQGDPPAYMMGVTQVPRCELGGR